ncbi:MAG: aminotransferase class I/II-fold pyridoxal phosphate-dependent enzyme [Chloroflexi bacterium]|nr:aminotransferase class I/II-fold pyridoxal phosphate-dependent enzyme [Chloroflexota bacterium]
MSPTPVTFTPPAPPTAYAWEATDEEVAARYGVRVDQIARFDLNTSPAPPEVAARRLARGAFEPGLSEYPPADYLRLAEAAGRRYGVEPTDLLVGAGADEVLDIAAKAFLPAAAIAIIPTPSYAMYRVLSEQRAAVIRAVPRRGPADGYSIDVGATRAAARGAALVWLCSPNNPTALPEPNGTIESLLDGLAADAAGAETRPPAVVLDEAYAEFVGQSLAELRRDYPRLVTVRTLSKAYGLAGLRVGFAIADPATIAELAPYRPPGSVSVVSVSVATAALEDDTALDANLERVVSERARLSDELTAAGWSVGPSVTNFLLVGFGSPERAAEVAEAMLRRGLVPRTFGPRHPLADHLRLTIRDRGQNDRLIDAAREIESGRP